MKKPYRLYNGDCFEILKDFPENTFDMVFADPPYMLSNGGISCQNGKMVSVNKGVWDKSRGITEDFEFHKKWLELCKRVLKPNGTLWVSGTYHSIYSCGFAMLLLDYHILNDISWFKPNASPNLSCKYFTASHESLIWARKNKTAKHYFNYEAISDEQTQENTITVEKKITANDIRARILSLPKIILDHIPNDKNTINVCFNNEFSKELTINKGRNYLAGVTEVYRKYGLLTEDNSIFPAISLWKLDGNQLDIDIRLA